MYFMRAIGTAASIVKKLKLRSNKCDGEDVWPALKQKYMSGD